LRLRHRASNLQGPGWARPHQPHPLGLVRRRQAAPRHGRRGGPPSRGSGLPRLVPERGWIVATHYDNPEPYPEEELALRDFHAAAKRGDKDEARSAIDRLDETMVRRLLIAVL